MSATIRAEPLSVERFAPFGQVVSAGQGDGVSANQGTAVRFNRAATLVNARPGATPNLAVFRSMPKELPFALRLLEKHPHSTQLFAPLVASRFLVCVAPKLADGSPDPLLIRAFLCGPGQGINYRADTWHHPILALDAPAEFLMLAWEDDGPQDCVERWFDEPVLVTT